MSELIVTNRTSIQSINQSILVDLYSLSIHPSINPFIHQSIHHHKVTVRTHLHSGGEVLHQLDEARHHAEVRSVDLIAAILDELSAAIDQDTQWAIDAQGI